MQKIGDIPNTRADNNGEFTDGNVAGGVPLTILPAEWFNTIQRELMSILNAAEIESDPHVFNQVLLSIPKLVSEGIPDLKDASLTQQGMVQLSNSTNSTSQILAATPKAVSDLGKLLLKITNNLPEIKDAGPVAVAQTLLNLGLGDAAKMDDVKALVDAVFPVGIPLPYPLADIPAPAQGIVWFKMNGGSFNTTTYPKLAAKYPTGVLPDLRGEVIRGWDDGRGVDVSRVLLSGQLDAIRNITGGFIFSGAHGIVPTIGSNISGAFTRGSQVKGAGTALAAGSFQDLFFDAPNRRSS
ncbi:phage tail protein [Yersinia enterocolitica]|uniref:phage tail protein n=1 Tax=Yersinia enterocolitica TaxID=630 RepID=UPI0036D527AB